MSDDPMTVLAEGMAQLHETYTGAVEAGFTEAQAMQIVCQILALQAGSDE